MTKNKLSYIAFLSVIAIVQSCSTTKNYKDADLSLNKLDTMYFDSSTNDEMVTISYDKYFNDDVLNQLIKEVLENNNDLIDASENLKASEALLKSTKLNYLPDVNLQINPSVQKLSKNSMIGGFAESLTYQDYTIGPALSWELDLWGKLKGERAEAVSLYLAQSESIRAIKIQLITQTATAYYNLIFLQNQQNQIKVLKDFANQSVQLIEKQYNYGDASSIAVKQAKDQVFELEKTEVELSQSIKNQEVALSTLMGKYPDKFSLASDITFYNFSINKDSQITVNQLKNRPDVKRAELNLRAANARVGINKAAMYPSVNISFQGGLNSVTAGNIFNVPASLFGNLAGGITQPIFNKRRLKSNSEQAVHLREASIANFKQEVVKSVAEVTVALNNLNYLEQQQAVTKDKLDNLVHTIEDAQKLYQYGEITYLEILAIQQLYIQANLGYLQVHRNTIDANIYLFKAIGG